MSPRTKEQNARIREDRRVLILDAALEIFAKQGISHATIDQIARKAGISKGLIYNYFSSKEELLDAIIKSSMKHLYAFMDPDHDGILTTKEMEFFIGQQIRMLKQNIDFWRFIFMILVQPSAQKMIRQLQEEVVSSPMWGMILTYFRKHGFEDPELETWFFHSMLDGIYMNYVFNPDHFPIDRMKKRIIQRFCKP